MKAGLAVHGAASLLLSRALRERKEMKRQLTACAVLVGMATALSACTNPYDPNQRALGGAAIGAGTGAAIGGIAGGGRGAAIGALVGGAAGAVGGAATTPTPPPPPGYYGGPPPGYYQGPPPGYYQQPPPPPPYS